MQAQGIYDSVFQADVKKMPFPDGYFDIVFSTDVLGHIPSEEKDEVLSEVFRVTRRGGFSIHSFECDSESLLFRWAKAYPELYQKYFVEMYGHFGLEMYETACRRFKNIGFSPISESPDATKGYLRGVSSFIVFFDNEYKDKFTIIKIIVTTCRLFSIHRIIRSMVDFTLGLFVPLANLITPKNHRDSLKVIYRKPSICQSMGDKVGRGKEH